MIQKEIFPYLPGEVRSLISGLESSALSEMEEIRLRAGRPLSVGLGGCDMYVNRFGGLSVTPEKAYLVTENDLTRAVSAVTDNSLYALEEELRRGYITLPGGHRVGLAGRTVLDHGEIRMLTNISGCAFRVARQVHGVGRAVIGRIADQGGGPRSTLIISPPRCGKTTLLRDLTRLFSIGYRSPGRNVVVIDERSEIAGCYHGIPQLDVGPRTDVLDACPKSQGMIMAVRSLSPELIVTDELGRPEDIAAIEECINAGVKILATAHGASLEEVSGRPGMRSILSSSSFAAAVVLSRAKGPGTLERIIQLSAAGGDKIDCQTGGSGNHYRSCGVDRTVESRSADPADPCAPRSQTGA